MGGLFYVGSVVDKVKLLSCDSGNGGDDSAGAATIGSGTACGVAPSTVLQQTRCPLAFTFVNIWRLG